MSKLEDSNSFTGLEIAIVGMSGRFPGADDVEKFWMNVRDGVESIKRFSDDELREMGVPQATIDDPEYVKAGVPFNGFDQFDAAFFGYAPREAQTLDPQQRIFLECAWASLEHAGCDPERWQGRIGVYAGEGANVYLIRNLLPSFGIDAHSGIADLLGLMSGNSSGSLCTRVAYKLNLKGPAVSVQTACSTSLTAVHTACQALLSHECDMALAGGVWLNLLQEGGYKHQAGAILSPDGYCRAFDADAAGTVIGSGAGIVVLKRLEEALQDGDTIHAVIKGTAANNDGSAKIGFTAPSVEGQAQVIRSAHLIAGVSADTIGYVEAHGTGTKLGDPIEIAALTQAFRGDTERSGFCAVGSVKTNIGHLDAAAGVAGLIKAAMAVRDGILPASLHFQSPNPQIDFDNSPFYVSSLSKPWPGGAMPRRAGVSSFGIGGTNVHVVLEEPPSMASPSHDSGWHIFPLSARSAPALRKVAGQLKAHLGNHPDTSLADTAQTLQNGRSALALRSVIIADASAPAIESLSVLEVGEGGIRRTAETPPEVAFLFPGGGTQHANMALALYREAPVFRECVDQCLEILARIARKDIRWMLYPDTGHEAAADEQLARIEHTQPLLFIVEYAMAKLWISRGVVPSVMLGHSLGEYVAACLAGVFSLEDAIRVVTERGRLMQSMEAGAMTAVALSEQDLQPFLCEGCDIAAINGPELCVVAGPMNAIETVEERLTQAGMLPRRLRVSIASHSAMTDVIVGELQRVVEGVQRHAPSIPFVSNVTGALISAEEAIDPVYWGRHLRGTVRFADGLTQLLEEGNRILLEVGPGETLSGLARQHTLANSALGILSSQLHPQQQAHNERQMAAVIGELWCAGVSVDWNACHPSRQARRVPLPTYPFQRQSYWREASSNAAGDKKRFGSTGPFYLPVWSRIEPTARRDAEPAVEGAVLVIGGPDMLADALIAQLRDIVSEGPIIRVRFADSFCDLGDQTYAVRAGERSDYETLLHTLQLRATHIGAIHHLGAVDVDVPAPSDANLVLERGFFSVLALIQALDTFASATERTLPLQIVVNQMEDVSGSEVIVPEKSTVFSLGKVIAQEYPWIACRVIDIALPQPSLMTRSWLVQQLANMEQGRSDAGLVAYRGTQRWSKIYESLQNIGDGGPQRLRMHGVYLITGGLGGVGLAVARHLATSWKARLVLLGRSPIPARADWERLAGDSNQPSELRSKLQQLLDFEALGAEVMVCSANVAEMQEMQAVMSQVRQRFGALNGLIHAAGHAHSGMIGLRTRAMVDSVFAPKLEGTRCLLAVSREEPLDFVLLCSSISSMTGGLGKSDYAAANAYLDAFAWSAQRTMACPVFSVNWDAWRDLGMAAGMVLPEGIGMNGPEGARVLEQIVNGAAHPQIVISTTDLQLRLGPLDNGMLDVLDSVESRGAGAERDAGIHPRPSLSTPFVAPQGELETALETIWTERLGIAPIGVDDNFFELGGDSLVAIQLISRIRKAYATELHPSEFFKAPTITGLAKRLSSSHQKALPQAVLHIDVVPRGGHLPLSPMQRRLWLVDRLAGPENVSARAAYNIAAGLHVLGELDLGVLRSSINAIVERHEVLRTVFVEDEEGEPGALIRPEVTMDIPLFDIPGKDEAERWASYHTMFDAMSRAPLSLAHGPLLKAAIARFGEREHVLVLIVHHIVFDGWSIAVFARELGDFYAQLLSGKTVKSQPLVVQYADYAAWYHKALQTSYFTSHTDFWRGYLSGAPQVSGFRTDFARVEVATHVGDAVCVEMTPLLVDSLSKQARACDTSLFTLLFATFSLFLHQVSGEADVVVGTDVAGRRHPDLEQLLGFFVNVVPLRTQMSDPQEQFSAWLQKTKQSTLAAMDHQEMPFDQIVEISSAARVRGRNPLVQVLFVLQNTPDVQFNIAEARVEVLPQRVHESKFDLAIFATEKAGSISVQWVYSTGLYRRESVERLAASWHSLLERVAAQPDQALADLAPSDSFMRKKEHKAMTTVGTSKKLDKLGKLGLVKDRPRTVALPGVNASYLESGKEFPIVLQADSDELDTVVWAKEHAAYIEGLVAKHGGILFRNFGLKTPQDFEAFAEAIEPELYGSYGDLPKKEGGKKTYRSTPYPEKQMILYHNESSHLDRWPRKQWFFCELPAPVGGATPIVDCREVLRRLPRDLVSEFERKELLYVRTFTPGLDVSWKEFYKTDDRNGVERRLELAGISWRWLDEDTLQTSTPCPAVITHPLTGDRVFFNQIQLHHIGCLEPQVREDLLETAGLDRLPRHVTYGDGSPISDEAIETISRIYEECAVRFQWQQGDVVMLDNMLAAHARDPYEGPRKIVVAMGAMFDRSMLEAGCFATRKEPDRQFAGEMEA